VGEKRLATVLYADISGFTELTTRIGMEKTTDFINECFNNIDEIINRHGGTIIRHEGDRVIAIFGFPRSYGNDSNNALLSSLKIKEHIRKMKYDIDVHIGVGTGEVLISDNEIYGHIFDEVAALEEKAEKGQIFVNEECYRINKGLFIFEDCENGYQLIGRRPLKQEPEFIVKCWDKEYEQLKQAMMEMPRFIIVSGERGIGKSTFIREGIKRITSEKSYAVYETTLVEQDYFMPFSSILNIVCQIKPDFKISISEERFKNKMWREMASVILLASHQNPLVIIFKNAEVMDEATRGFFEYLKSEMEGSKLIIIFETRDDNFHKKLAREKDFAITNIHLQCMDDEIILEIINHNLKEYPLHDSFKKSALALCAGNPDNAMRLSIYIKNSFPPGTALKEIPFSGHIQEITEALIDTIPLEYLNGLFILSLFNKGVELPLIYKLMSNTDDFLNYCLSQRLLLTRGMEIHFVSEHFSKCLRSRLTKKKLQAFHKKIADILIQTSETKDYGYIAYHLKNAGELEGAIHYLKNFVEYLESEFYYEQCIPVYDEILELLSEDRVDERIGIQIKKAQLFHIMGEREEELKTIRQLQDILNQSDKKDYRIKVGLLYANYLEAIADYEGALKVLNELRMEKEDALILEKIGINYYNKNNMAKGIEVLNQALSLAQNSDDYSLTGNIFKDIGLCYWKLGDKDQALFHYKKARTYYEKNNDRIALSRLNVNIANVYYYLSQFEQALVYYNEALNTARKINDPIFLAQILSNIGGVYIRFGEYEKALENFQEALEIDRRRLNRRGEAIRLSNIGHVYGMIGELKKAIEYFIQALKIDESIKNTAGIAIRYGNIATCCILGEDYEAGIKYLTKALELSESIGAKDYIAYYHNVIGFAYLKTGDLDKAEFHLDKGYSMARLAKNLSYEIIAHSTFGLLYLTKGDLKKALQHSNWAVKKLLGMKEIEGDKEQIYFIHYKILQKLSDSEGAKRYLQLAYESLIEQSSRFKNEEHQRKFLEISKNKEIIEEWRRVLKQE